MLDFKSIRIYDECNPDFRKILKPGLYDLKEAPIPDFFGDNVRAHVLVGKNGSGKSSLLDMLFRMVNNVGALMCKNEERKASARVRYIKGIYADFAYTKEFPQQPGELHHGLLCIRENALWIEYDDNVYWLSDNQLIEMWPNANEYINSLEERFDDDHFMDFSGMVPADRNKVAEIFFYTLATNFSILGFQASDYENEDSLEFEDVYLTTENDEYITTENDEPISCWQEWVEHKNWIPSLFHKNDGYMCPIVLNPYRDRGLLNVANESYLTARRLAGLMIYSRKYNKTIIENYTLDKVTYELRDDIYQKFTKIIAEEDKDKSVKRNLLADGGDLLRFTKAAQIKGTTSWIILDAFNCGVDERKAESLSCAELYARLYLAYKVLTIAGTYPAYADYAKLGNVDNVLAYDKKAFSPRKLRELCAVIENRFTHIEQKVHQTLHFIRLMNDARASNPNLAVDWLNTTFTFDEYFQHLEPRKNFESIEELMRFLPPNIFRQVIYLKRKNDDGTETDNIPFSKLSSGEKQMLYQLSTVVYHLINLKSVPTDECHYSHVNIVLDEIEVCFHPEYQRCFISMLLDLIVNRLELNKYMGIHFWITTHSPFILSDFPEELICYMRNGHQLTDDEVRENKILPPMAANINEILHQSFFLKKGFIGEYVRDKILSLAEWLQDNNQSQEWDYHKVRLFINGIKEPYISRQLNSLFSIKYQDR